MAASKGSVADPLARERGEADEHRNYAIVTYAHYCGDQTWS